VAVRQPYHHLLEHPARLALRQPPGRPPLQVAQEVAARRILHHYRQRLQRRGVRDPCYDSRLVGLVWEEGLGWDGVVGGEEFAGWRQRQPGGGHREALPDSETPAKKVA
jgi:hypothetical protein